MATRSKTDVKRDQLKAALRERCRSGQLAAGRTVPPVRDLAGEFTMSPKIVVTVLKELVEEGLLYTVPRVGTFVGPNRRYHSDCYLLITGDEPVAASNEGSQLQWGFETCIAETGGAVLAMNSRAAMERFAQNSFPPLSGVFDFSWKRKEQLRRAFESYSGNPSLKNGLPCVRFVDKDELVLTHDVVSTDDYNGGRMATQYLLEQGHRSIAFLGLHNKSLDLPTHFNEDIREHWSTLRELGWRHEMQVCNVSTRDLVFLPEKSYFIPKYEEQRNVARSVAMSMVKRTEITAIVTANDATALGLIDALYIAELPPSSWPAIVGFDDMTEAKDYFITSLRVPWAEIGRAAATLLIERRHDKLQGPPQHRKVAMSLVQRLSSHSEWRKFMSHETVFNVA